MAKKSDKKMSYQQKWNLKHNDKIKSSKRKWEHNHLRHVEMYHHKYWMKHSPEWRRDYEIRMHNGNYK